MVIDENQGRIQDALGDKYEIKHLIQAGGMGKIYLGIHKALDKKVAIKIIHQELVQNEQIKSRFFREAKLAASLDHYGIIDIYDFGGSDDFAYIIMPFIEGETLDTKIKEQGAIALEESIRIMIEITEALHYAHTHNVIHRDIKPSNIMFDRQGKIIIADFGISKDLSDSDLTAPNTVLGSPKYMSPEQIKGQTVDGRSDLYSLGLVFYEMVTGSHPFHGRDNTSIYYAQAHEIPPRPETKKPDIPKNIGAIIMKLLDKNPESRYADGEALIKDLNDYQNGTFSAISDTSDDATRINDATIVDDGTMLMGAMEASVAEPAPYDDATMVAPLPEKVLPFYKKHTKALAGAGAALVLLISIIMIIGTGGNEAPPPVRHEPATEPAASSGTSPSHATTPETHVPAPSTDATEPELPDTRPEKRIAPTSLKEAIFAINNGKTTNDFSLWTDSDTYRIGETLNFYFESKKPCYAVILGYTTQKELIQIFPNHYASSQFIQANRRYSIPNEKMDFDLEVFGPPGQEIVIALISESPFSLFESTFNADIPFLSFNEKNIPRTKDFYERIDAIGDREIYQQQLVYTIIN